MLESVTSAIVGFFSTQPLMLDNVPPLGHVPKIFRSMSAKNDAIPKSAIQITHQLANSLVSIKHNKVAVAFFAQSLSGSTVADLYEDRPWSRSSAPL